MAPASRREFLQIHLLGYRLRIGGPAAEIAPLRDSLYTQCQEPPEATPDAAYRVEAEGGAILVYSAGTGTPSGEDNPGAVFTTGDRAELFWWLERVLCEGAIARAEGMLLIHGAAVERGGRATIILGKSYSGKSTLTIHLIRNGFRLLSDEVVLVDMKSLRLRPFPRNVLVREGALRGGASPRESGAGAPSGEAPSGEDGAGDFDGVEDTGGLEGLELGRWHYKDPGGEIKWLVDPAALSASGLAVEARVGRIVWLQRHRRWRPLLEPVGMRAVVEMMVSHAVNLEERGGEGVDAIVRMARSAENLRLRAPHAGEAWGLLREYLKIGDSA